MNFKKSLLATALLAFIGLAAFAQEKASPAKTAEGMVGDAKVTINYSSPAVKGRMIWGDLVPLGEVWRAGANEATTFTTTKDIMVEGKKLAAGTYSFFVIPGEASSTFIFNKVAKQWGAFDYSSAEDALRVTVPSGQTSSMEERLVYEVKPSSFEIRWEYGKASAKLGS
ncbi:DUF2911 domain-containing protein [Algoriphagus aquimarinus]|uniref:DUF2911 domain-containing protein n=1 Tax=Algoriphagus aquimarinus TaxID=237018 RepID=A0A1I1AJX7_9BACT|nr:DUF2911 domain-containing protein [Algoriphagus aquimarinus]SFB37666.1 Protein of unknown function [Algoriphagus aquimarinus]|tara:strand:- start:126910 stop:127416 length:507 start_codon:yes stop_codon:yes gene_type:complete